MNYNLRVDYKAYLSQQLEDLKEKNIIDDYKIEKDLVIVSSQTAIMNLFTDFSEIMEIQVNDYFRLLTDYSVGDFRETIDTYLEIIKKIGLRDYTLITYLRGNKLISRRIRVVADGHSLEFGDMKNHFVLFARKQEVNGASLSNEIHTSKQRR
jgi:hypothetical protein